jgi:hypothetical protein
MHFYMILFYNHQYFPHIHDDPHHLSMAIILNNDFVIPCIHHHYLFVYILVVIYYKLNLYKGF